MSELTRLLLLHEMDKRLQAMVCVTPQDELHRRRLIQRMKYIAGVK
jgi:hypothetical protein